jgi:hypothetical protein
MRPHSRGAMRPSRACILASQNRGRGECRVPAAPAASCAKCSNAHECRHHESTGTPGIPARNGFNGFLRALPGDRAFLSPSSSGYGFVCPVGPTWPPLDLTPASRRQDHTTSPSAATSFVSPPCDRSQAHLHGPALPSPRALKHCRVHRIPPRVHDDRDTPLGDETAGDIEVIWVRRERKYFCKRGWTAEQPVGQISRPVRRSSKSESGTRNPHFIVSERRITLSRPTSWWNQTETTGEFSRASPTGRCSAPAADDKPPR